MKPLASSMPLIEETKKLLATKHMPFPAHYIVSSSYNTSLHTCTFCFHELWDITDYWPYLKIVLPCTSFITSEENSTSSRPWVGFSFHPWRNGKMACMYTGSKVVEVLQKDGVWRLIQTSWVFKKISDQKSHRNELALEISGNSFCWPHPNLKNSHKSKTNIFHNIFQYQGLGKDSE